MKKLRFKNRKHTIFIGIFVFNILSFVFGILPPAGRANYLPSIIVILTMLFMFYFMLCMPFVCLGGAIYAAFLAIKEPLRQKKSYLVWIPLLIAELMLWYPVFELLMSV